jgi:hypothetical protein
MKPIHFKLGGALALSLALAACVPRPGSAPPAQTRPVPTPTPVPTPAPIHDSWMDAPATAGDWSYRGQADGGIAAFGDPSSGARFTIRCDLAGRTIVLSRAGQGSGAGRMIVRTESQMRALTAKPASGALPAVEARVAAGDRLLDAMALGKGRFAIEVTGAPTLFLPSWAEVSRAIEDCR